MFINSRLMEINVNATLSRKKLNQEDVEDSFIIMIIMSNLMIFCIVALIFFMIIACFLNRILAEDENENELN